MTKPAKQKVGARDVISLNHHGHTALGPGARVAGGPSCLKVAMASENHGHTALGPGAWDAGGPSCPKVAMAPSYQAEGLAS